jgi:large subunit ribosomal protein L24
MKIKKDDNVIVIAGKDKGKTGTVVQAFPKDNLVLISGVNVKKRHQRARKGNEKGQVLDKALPIHASNVMIVDPKTNKRSRVGKKLTDGKYVRVAKKSGTTLK